MYVGLVPSRCVHAVSVGETREHRSATAPVRCVADTAGPVTWRTRPWRPIASGAAKPVRDTLGVQVPPGALGVFAAALRGPGVRATLPTILRRARAGGPGLARERHPRGPNRREPPHGLEPRDLLVADVSTLPTLAAMMAWRILGCSAPGADRRWGPIQRNGGVRFLPHSAASVSCPCATSSSGAGGSRTGPRSDAPKRRSFSNRNESGRFRRPRCGVGCGLASPPVRGLSASRSAMVVPRVSSNPPGHVTFHPRPFHLGQRAQSPSTHRHSHVQPRGGLPTPAAHGLAPLPDCPAPPRDLPGPGRRSRPVGRWRSRSGPRLRPVPSRAGRRSWPARSPRSRPAARSGTARAIGRAPSRSTGSSANASGRVSSSPAPQRRSACSRPSAAAPPRIWSSWRSRARACAWKTST